MSAPRKGRAVISLLRELYPRESLEAGALVLGERAEVRLTPQARHFEVEINGTGRTSEAALRALVGEFLNEALSHTYRQKVIRFHAASVQPALVRVLREGFSAMPEDPLEMLEPQVRADRRRETKELFAQAKSMKKNPRISENA